MSEAVWAEPIEALAPKLKAKSLSPVELLDACMARIERHDGTLQSFICLTPDARDQAKRAEEEIAAGRWRGPLHGIPIAIKDNYLTKDMPTTVGTLASGYAYPMRDSAAASRLREAGASGPAGDLGVLRFRPTGPADRVTDRRTAVRRDHDHQGRSCL